MLDRRIIIDRLQAQLRCGNRIVGAVGGCGVSAKCAVQGGADLILALSAGRLRHMGCGSLACMMPYGNSNRMVMDYAARELIPQLRDTPLIFGLSCTDPTIKVSSYLDQIAAAGFSGVINYPSVGQIDGKFREALEECGLSYDVEVETLALAHEKGLFTIAFVYDEGQARKMLSAGVDMICALLGVTQGGHLGVHHCSSLERSVQLTRRIASVCRAHGGGVFCTVYGGALNTPADLEYCYAAAPVDGFLGGSCFDRIPAELAFTRAAQNFKSLGTSCAPLPASGCSDAVTFVKQYISDHFADELSFQELARMVHVSRSYLSSLFRQEVGCTFPEYITRIRINKAIELLNGAGPASCGEIARAVGYQDYSHFCKVFKKATGISPSNYAADGQRQTRL